MGLILKNVNITGGKFQVNPTPGGGAMPLKTNQTTSFRTGDDGNIQAGRDVSFFTLEYTNPFGNNNRFTDTLGNQTYADDIVMDWSTYQRGKVLGYYRGDQTTARNWDDAIDWGIALSVGIWATGWRLTNIQELFSICIFQGTFPAIRYSPINGVSSTNYWTSTTYQFNTTNAYRITSNTGVVGFDSKTTTQRTLAVRVFTVTGTILT